MHFSRDDIYINSAHIFMDGLFDSIPIILTFMAIFYGAGEKDAGFVVSLGVLLSTVMGLSVKFFSRTCGLWRTLALVMLCAGMGFAGSAFCASFGTGGAFLVLSVLGFGLFHNITFAHLSTLAEQGRLGKTLGDFAAVGDIGRIPIASFAGFAAAFTLWGEPGWRGVSLLYGLVTIGFAGILLLYARRTPTVRAGAEGKGGLLPSFALMRQRPVALAMSTGVLDAFCSGHVFTFLPFLLFAKGIDPKVIGGFALAFTVGSFAGKALFGRLTGIYNARPVFVCAELLMGVLLLIMVLAQQLWVIIAASIALGVVTKGTMPVLHTLVVEPIKDSRQYEDIFSLSTLFRGGVSMTTPVLFGLLAAWASIEWVYALMAVVAVLAVIPLFFINADTADGV